MEERFWFTPIAYSAFGVLTAQSKTNVDKIRSRGQYTPITDVPRPVADRPWRDHIFLPADAIIWVAIDLLRQQGITRNALKASLRDIQLYAISAFNALDDDKEAMLALTHDGRRYAVACACSGADAVKLTIERFADLGVSDISKLRSFCVSLRAAYEIVSLRARANSIPFPRRVWPTPGELGAGASLPTQGVAPRRSSIIKAWLAGCAGRTEGVRSATSQPSHKGFVSMPPGPGRPTCKKPLSQTE
ncbi:MULTISPECIES: hypothetical protein [unclassified Bradyrhizobium]|uniref:hypothetical protein n=1 Tax=unclassified Bradyrhizobium TaxID=2631580 RepID=UPI002FF21ED3